MCKKKCSIKNGLLIIIMASLVGCTSSMSNSSCQAISSRIRESSQRSLGEEMLITNTKTPTLEKEKLVKHFDNCDFEMAVEQLDSAINDPEARIYHNNAIALNANQKPSKIVVSIPITKNEGVAQEILRGVALAQHEFNLAQENSDNQRFLLVEIADDENNPKMAKKLANEFVKDSNILAVVGHNSSTASLSALPVYHQGGLVMISPTSTTNNLPVISNYVFRTVVSDYKSGEALSNYIAKQSLNKIAFCIDSTDADANSLQKTLKFFMKDKIVNLKCDIQLENINVDFNVDTIINQAIENQVQGIFIIPSVKNVDKAIEIAKANTKQGKKLRLFSGNSMYQFDTLEKGKSDLEGMVLAVPWHRDQQDQSNLDFQNKNKQLFGDVQISWRTAIAYNATKVILEGLKNANTREQLREVLARDDFSVMGATEMIQFDQSGEAILVGKPMGKTKLVEIKLEGDSYGFVSIPSSEYYSSTKGR